MKLKYQVIVASGSRSLAGMGDKPRVAWEKLLESHLDPDVPMILVTGDADGIDRWSFEWAKHHKLWKMSRVYALDGQCHQFTPNDYSEMAWCGKAKSINPKRLPLIRNQVMLARTLALMIENSSVFVLGGVDPQSKTAGTRHTLTKARELGIPAKEFVWDQTSSSFSPT